MKTPQYKSFIVKASQVQNGNITKYMPTIINPRCVESYEPYQFKDGFVDTSLTKVFYKSDSKLTEYTVKMDFDLFSHMLVK